MENKNLNLTTVRNKCYAWRALGKMNSVITCIPELSKNY